MDISSFDYQLPEDLIAQEPLADRGASRMLVLNRATGKIKHRGFSDLPSYLEPLDCLVINKTRVLSARLMGHKNTGAKIEIFLLREVEEDVWEALCRPAKRLRVGADVRLDEDVGARVIEEMPEGRRLVRFDSPVPLRRRLKKIGKVPLPPYIHKALENGERYQTVYADVEGSVAAPTAGLHFTKEMLEKIKEKGIKIAKLNLDIGIDTFRPVTTPKLKDHIMHAEKYSLPAAAAKVINETKKQGGRVTAVGTTSVRVLETVAAHESGIKKAGGYTELFIYPGYRFKVVDRLLTNFHLPRSTLIVLVSAFAGRDLIMRAYQEAIKEKYRFFSFGDAMLII